MQKIFKGIWYILVNGEEFEKFYNEEKAVDKFEQILENKEEYDLDTERIELVKVLKTTKVNEEPVENIGYNV